MKKLPKSVKIDTEQVIDSYTLCGMQEAIMEYLQDKYGYEINGFEYKIDINVKNIEWEIEE